MPAVRSGIAGPLHTVVDDADRAILEAVLADPGIGTGQLAELVGLSAANVSRRLARLGRCGVLRVIGRTAPGFGQRTPRLDRVHGAPEALDALAARARSSAGVTWVRASRDRTQLMVGSTGTSGELVPVVAGACSDPALRVECHELLHVWTTRPAALAAPRPLDALDQALLEVLADNGRMTSASLGARLGVDATTAARRRHRLTEEGVLYLEAVVHPAALGQEGDCMVWLEVAPGHVRRLGARLRAQPVTRFVAATSGDTQLVVTIGVPCGGTVLDLVDGVLADESVRGLDVVPLHQGVVARA